MRILVRMPNWIGDAVMATPALENIKRHFPGQELVLVASAAVAEMLAVDPSFQRVIVDRCKSHRVRPYGFYATGRQLAREIGPIDVAFCFTNSLSSKAVLWVSRAKRRVGMRCNWTDRFLTDAIAVDHRLHQAELLNQLVNDFLGTSYETGPTTLHVPAPVRYARPTLGINPGAAYGSAKRWDPRRFAAVGAQLADRYDLAIFGGPNEAAMAAEIEAVLRDEGVTNFENWAARTTLPELLNRIAGLSLFITNDSGPMHIAGALGVPSVAIFGSTDHTQTSQWRNPRSVIVRHELDCAPCLQRTCPLQHHLCMEGIQAHEVIAASLQLTADEPLRHVC